MGESRNDTLVTSLEIKYKDLYQRTREHRKELGISFKEYIEKYVPKEELEREQSKIVAQGVSILDPVMAEIVCRWFGFKNCQTFDCFAATASSALFQLILVMTSRVLNSGNSKRA